jgi:hypothetical protein
MNTGEADNAPGMQNYVTMSLRGSKTTEAISYLIDIIEIAARNDV